MVLLRVLEVCDVLDVLVETVVERLDVSVKVLLAVVPVMLLSELADEVKLLLDVNVLASAVV